VSDRLLDWAIAIAAAEEMARAKVVVRPEVKIAPAPAVRTVVGREVDFPIPGTIIDERGSGCLRELLIRSGFREWRLAVFADGQQLYNDEYGWFEGVGAHVGEVAAFQAGDGSYVLHLSDIRFAESLRVAAAPSSVATLGAGRPRLSLVYWKLELAVE